MYNIAVIAGDGIGPEVIAETLEIGQRVIDKYKLDITFDCFPYGADYYLETGITIPEKVFQEWPQTYSAILLGALGDPRVPSNIHAEDILMGFRRKLNLYVNFRPVKLLDKQICPLKQVKNEKDVDFSVFRENTEGLYAGIGGCLKEKTNDETAMETCIYTHKSVKRIIEEAFAFADQHSLPEVLMSDKSNVMRHVGGLWQRVFTQIAEKYPHIRARHMYIDALCMQVIRDPSQFSVIVTSNMFGDIFTDAAAQVQGGMGIAASANYNPQDNVFLGLFEPVHGSAPDIAGQNKANPMATVLSLELLLHRLGYNDAAGALTNAVKQTLASGTVTKDLGGSATCSEVARAINQNIM